MRSQPEPAPTAPVAPSQDPAPAPPVDRTLALLATDGAAYLVHWMVILTLVSQAATSVLRPPEGVVAVGVVAGLVCLVWSAFCLGMGILRGSRPDGADLPPPVWLSVVSALGCLTSLVLVRSGAGLAGPWTSELAAAGLLVASTTVWGGATAGAAAGLVLSALFLVTPLADRGEPLVRTPLADAVSGIALMAVSFAIALALRWVRRSAQQQQASLDDRDEVRVREHAVLAAARVAAEVERSLHDTALNTLETIAAHGDHLDPGDVVARCRADAEQLSGWRSEYGLTTIDALLDRLQSHADRIGVAARIERVAAPPGQGPGVRVPPPVLHAFAGAGTEALTNVAKHSGVRRATVLVVHDDQRLELLVADAGVGPGRVGDGFGVAHSVRRRIEAVGGSALVSPGPDDVGTVVALDWQPVPEELPAIGSDLLARIAGVVVAVGTLLAGVASALVVLGWPAYAHPWPALIGPVVPVLVAAWILNQAREGIPIGAGHVVAACATYVLVGSMAVLADPYCAAPLGEAVVLDARAPLVATVLLLAPRPRVLAALVATVGASHVGLALAWNAQWVQCGPDTAEAGVYAVAGLGAIWLFATRIDRVTREYAALRAQATQAEVRMQAQVSVRAEEELWVADTLSSAQELLDALAEGRLHPGDPATRARCANEAQFLRALLAVGRAPDALRRPARIWLRLLHAADCGVLVRGTFAGCHPPAHTIGHVGGVLDTVSALAPGAQVTLTAWVEPTVGSLMVSVTGPPVAAHADTLSARVHRVAGEAWRDFGSDELSVEWTWPHGEPTPPQGRGAAPAVPGAAPMSVAGPRGG